VLIIGAGVYVVRRALRDDRTVIDRMRSPSRADGSRDPRSYIPHSHF
jgi:hypothetical protein